MHQFRSILVLTLFVLLSSAISAQEWKYNGPDAILNASACDSWIDDAGNSYHNIAVFETKGTRKSLLILDKNGNFNGRVQINSCQNRASLFPFNDGMYLTTDYNCIGQEKNTKDSRVFDHKGNLVLTGDPFALSRFAAVRSTDGYTIFSQLISKSKPPMLGLRDIDWDFNIEDRQVELTELAQPNFSMVADISTPPIQTADGNWLLVMSYGEEHQDKKGSLITHSMLFLTDGKSILDKFQFEEKGEMVRALKTIGNDIAVLTTKRGTTTGPRKLYILDQQLHLKKTLTLDMVGYFDAFLITQHHIILLENRYDWENMANTRYFLNLYDLEGNLLKERQLNMGRMRVNTLSPFGENSILLAGSVILSDSVSYSIAWKLDIDPSAISSTPQVATTTVEAPTAPSPSPIANMTVEELSQAVMSVAVFPNPASIYINFALKNRDTGPNNLLLKVTSMEGKLMHQASFQDVFYELDIANFPPGTYAYQIINQGDKSDFLTGKFVKMR